MSNKVYIGFIVLFLLAVSMFLFVRNKNGSFNEVKITKLTNTVHEMRGVFLEGSFKNEKDRASYDKVERSLIEDYGLEEVSAFYYLNPSEENREAYKVFLGEELKSGLGSLPDSMEKRTFVLKNVIKGMQKASPTFNTVSDKIRTYLEEICKKDSTHCVTLKQDSIFEQYTRDGIVMEMQLED